MNTEPKDVSMSPEAQRIAIAIACGWTDVRKSGRWEVSDPPEDPIQLCGLIYCQRAVIPDYLNDLNAMHEAEKSVIWPSGKFLIYSEHVCRAMSPDRIAIPLLFATAKDRAEAFLISIGKRKAR